MQLCDRIRQTIHPLHERLEKTPLARAITTAQVSRADYVNLLAQMLPIHAALESAWRHSAPTNVPPPNGLGRAELVARDLVALGPIGYGTMHPAARALIANIEAWGDEPGLQLLGPAYVFEGARMGSMYLARPLAKSLGIAAVAGQGLDYHLEGAEDQPTRWREWKRQLDLLPLNETEQLAVVATALATMEFLLDLYGTLITPETEAVHQKLLGPLASTAATK